MVVMDKKTILVTGILCSLLCQIFIPIGVTADEPLPSLTIVAPAQVNETESFEVTVLSNGTAIENASVTFSAVTKTTTTGTLTFTAPVVSVTVDYNITATALGYTNITETIKVVNVPSLKITLTGTKGSDGKYFSPITVTASDDTGGLVTGATVTFTDQTSTIVQTLTTVNGQVTFFIEKSGIYTITATLPGEKIVSANPVTINICGFVHDDGELFCYLAILIVFVFIVILVLIVLYYKHKK